MSLTIAFQMEPLAEVNPVKNSSLVLIREAQSRGHTIYQYHPRELHLDRGQVIARARTVTIDESHLPPSSPEPTSPSSPESALADSRAISNAAGDRPRISEDENSWNDGKFYTLGEDEWLNLANVDVVQIRQDPPFNMEYITATYMLERIYPDTLVVNPPLALRNLPEKLFPLEFPDFTPHTIISEDPEAIKKFWREEKDIIIKPLYLFGGQGVFRAQHEAEIEEIVEKLVKETGAPIVAQPFLPEVALGDKRIILIDGKPIAAFNRVPQAGSVRANLMQGGSLQPAEITPREHEICATLGPELRKHNIIICGIDMIGDYLTEINITSPIGFLEIQNLYNINAAAILWDAIEKKL